MKKKILTTIIILLFVLVSLSTGIQSVTVDPLNTPRDFTSEGVYYSTSNELYAVNQSMDFSEISIASDYVQFNDTAFYVTSGNDINITIDYMRESMEGEGYGDKVLGFYANTSSGNVFFNISGFHSGSRYNVSRGGTQIYSSVVNSTTYIRFNNSVWSEQYFNVTYDPQADGYNGWQNETINGTDNIHGFGLVYDASDTPHIFWKFSIHNNYNYHYAYENETGVWRGQIDTTGPDIISPNCGSASLWGGIAIGTDGSIHLAYSNYTTSTIHYVLWNSTNSSWDDEIVNDNAVFAGEILKTVLCLDSSNQPHLVYRTQGNGLNYTYKLGDTWRGQVAAAGADTVASDDYSSNYYSMVLDDNNYPYIAYSNTTGPDNLYYVNWTGTAWSTVNITNEIGDVGKTTGGMDTTIAIVNDYPGIAWQDGNKDIENYAYYNGSAWINETINGAETWDHSHLIVNSTDTPWVVSMTQHGTAVGYFRDTDNTWKGGIIAITGSPWGWVWGDFMSNDSVGVIFTNFTGETLEYALNFTGQPPAEANGTAANITRTLIQSVDWNGCSSNLYTNDSNCDVSFEFSLYANMSNASIYWDNTSTDVGAPYYYRYQNQEMANTLTTNATHYYTFTAYNSSNSSFYSNTTGILNLWSPIIGSNSPADGAIDQSPSGVSLSVAINISNGGNFTLTFYNGDIFGVTETINVTGGYNGTYSYLWDNVTWNNHYEWCVRVDTNETEDNGNISTRYSWTNWYTNWGDGQNWSFNTTQDSPPIILSPNPANGSGNQPASVTFNVTIEDPEGYSFNWTIEGSNGQSNSSNGDVNGSKELIMTNLDWCTTYTVWVNATDGNLTNGTWYTFTTATMPAVTFAGMNPANGSLDQNLSLTWNTTIESPVGETFTWWINCSNGQTNTGAHEGNGSKSLAISGLESTTQYYIFVNATNNCSNWSKGWYNFTTKQQDFNVHTPYPSHQSVGIERPPVNLSAYVNGTNVNISIYFVNMTGTSNVTEKVANWTLQSTGYFSYSPLANSTLTTQFIWGGSRYYWSVNVTNGTDWINNTYYYTTTGSKYDVDNSTDVIATDVSVDWAHRSGAATYDGIYDVDWSADVTATDASIIWANRT